MAVTYTSNRAYIAEFKTAQIQFKLDTDSDYVQIVFSGEPKISVTPQSMNLGGINNTFGWLATFEFTWLQTKHGVDDVDLEKIQNVDVDYRFVRKLFPGDSTSYAILFDAVRAEFSFEGEYGDTARFTVRGSKPVTDFSTLFTTV